MRLFLFFIILAISNSLSSQEAIYDSLYQDAISNDDELGGTAVAMIHKGEVIFKKTTGLANLEHRLPVSSETLFHWASVSKQFTGIAIAKLILEGKIEMDDPVNRYIPEFPVFNHPITIKHLIYHTSGLREWSSSLQTGGYSSVFENGDVLRMLSKQEGLNFEPGTQFSYSNTGYTVLAMIIERVTEEDINEYFRDAFFTPLEMKNSFFRTRADVIIPNRANSYKTEDGKISARLFDELAITGASGLYSSINEMIKWAKYVVELDQNDPDLYDLIISNGFLKNGKKLPYSFGFWKDIFYGTIRIDHTGSWAGFKAYTLYLPEQDFASIGIRNFEQSIWKIQSPLLKKALENKLTFDRKDRKQDTDKYESSLNSILSTYDRKVHGVYKLSGLNYISLVQKDSILLAKVFPKRWGSNEFTNEHVVTKKSSNEYQIEGLGIEFRISRDSLNDLWIDDNQSGWIRYTRIPDKKISLEDYVGTYHSSELDVSYNIGIDLDKMYVSNLRIGKIPLKWIAGDEFDGNISSVDFISFIRNELNEVSRLEISTERSRNQVFKKINK